MHKISATVVFFGSGPVAAKALALLAEDFEIEAVITKPQPAHHKEDFPVLATSQKLGLKTFTPRNKVELSELFRQKPVRSRLGVVIDYGIIIAQDVIDYFPLGIVNSHFSLLPQWRGADPISFSILSGQKKTGVSLMLIVEALDEGPLLAQSEWLIEPDVTTPKLSEELIELSHELLKAMLPLYVAGKTEPAEQAAVTIADSKEPTYSRKLTKQDGMLDFSKPAEHLEREVRAFAGWPRSRTAIGDVTVIVTNAHVSEGQGEPGKLWLQDKQLGFYTARGVLVIDRLIPAGKKEMSAAAFLAGYKLR
ncbi:MAG TPA: methionyl-tRNA formyltransferase [Verrucomicrobiae bacterium]|nr:methionyl-tRNA formyltransferase [Verrucomicrobiae bacterium]